MREILFRGKRTDNDEWVEGFYQEYPEGYVHIQNTSNDWFPVIPKTVGQFTGLTDRSGKRIFEGDIIHCITFGFERDEFTTEIKFGARSGVQGFYLSNGRNMFYFDQSDLTRFNDALVIGNIYDNPELLEKN